MRSGAVLLHSYADYREIMPIGVSRARPCRQFRDRLGIGTRRVMAIGDGASDTTVIREVGVCVAVRVAVAQLRRVVD